MITKTIYLDTWTPAEVTIPVRQGEVDARFLHVHLLNNGVPVELTGCTATIFCTKPDGTTIFNRCEITDAAKGKVTIPITQQMSLIAGVMRDAELRITKGNSVLKVRGLHIVVRAAGNYDEAVESSNEFTVLQEALNASGCYIPSVSQPDSHTMTVAFTGSRDGMASVPAQNVTLPPGHTPVKGVDYFTDDDKAELMAAFLGNFTDASEVAL